MVALRQSELAGARASEPAEPPRDEIAAHHLIDETRLVGGLIERAVYSEDERRRTGDMARRLVHATRERQAQHPGVDAFMREYGLSSEEGIILMCLAEALLRIPDAETADKFITEKISGGQWERHLGHSESTFVNASTWGLMLTGRLMRIKETRAANPWESLKRLVARSGEPVIRQAVRHAVKLLGDQFVLGRTIKEAIARAADYEARGYRFSYDMLGEAAKTEQDAERYFDRYMAAVDVVGKAAGPLSTVFADALLARPSLSVKLSALHPRFEPGKEARLETELLPRLMTLLRAADANGLAITIDAEEQERLEPTLDLFARAYLDPSLAHWSGLGIAVQAYGKRAIPVIRWLRRLSERGAKRIPVRLVKGAYWDSEIKWAQERGLSDYPVLTRKLHTDVSYLACTRLLLSEQSAFYAQFATHNAHTVSAALVAGGHTDFEFQRLHGMGEALYEEVAGDGKFGQPCRIYAPVGDHEDLLSYLVRRLLENGANTSFVNRLADDEAPVAQIIGDPVEIAEQERLESATVRLLTKPREIYWPERKNSQGVPLTDRTARETLVSQMEASLAEPFYVGPIIAGEATTGGASASAVNCPHDVRERLGSVRIASPAQVEAAIARAARAAHDWDRLGGAARGKILDLAADMIERDRPRLMAVLVREAGKTLPAALAEVREAADLVRYYALEARRLMSTPVVLKGSTGEANTLELRGRGPFACIAPWNFPLAIFLGQVAAALAAGNTVLAKPAEQTPIAAFLATQILHDAGVPKDVLHLITGAAAAGAALVKSPLVKGVAFTGSNDVAWAIQRSLADRRGEIVPFIAETGGINAMIADSSALAEQVVRDAVRSAFDSAGQRCSAARVLFLQDDIASRTIRMLIGAIECLDVGDPFDYATDVGPVIDETSQDSLEAHKIRMQRDGRELIDMRLPEASRAGTYVAPAAYEIERMSLLDKEVFGPILHIVRFGRGRMDKVVQAVNASGFGLTIGLHSRIGAVADYVAEHARVGNLYVNRNQIGAVPGVQPFGGEGLSGTGPKAGGPNYLARFATERVRSTDVTATGGNVGLLTQEAAGFTE
ncbi:MAG: bifunctional proline dehydrogenase/L-glutamate gamma-semialdehyde dehydrogenase PutA [Hyphomicrobium sp.]|jgi:RHH-type proline utilization regulon transcriptional repressor/proline dehydrogenase/delta 1-pyrroline-5-carboxylate dehydrogenase